MEIIKRNGNLPSMNIKLERRMIKDDNVIGEEIKDEFEVVGIAS